LRFAMVGGKNFSPIQKQQALDTLGSVVYEYYGSTESGINTVAEPTDLRDFPRSVGYPCHGSEIVILDDQSIPIRPGITGRIAVASYLLMDAYVDGTSNEVYVNEKRYLITPDRGYLDESGRLYIVNRFPALASNIDVYSIEDSLRRLAGVKDVVVKVTRSNNTATGQVAHCALSLQPHIDNRDTVVESARQIIGASGIDEPRVSIVRKIPYSLSGKVLWGELDRLLCA
jgi:acyl-coenzyme A synthetase/AMP-(fatty) acid ligase